MTGRQPGAIPGRSGKERSAAPAGVCPIRVEVRIKPIRLQEETAAREALAEQARASREYVASLHNTDYLEIVGYLPTPESAERAIRRGEARVAVIIPPDFSRRSETTLPPTVRVLLDGSDSQVAVPARRALQRPSPVQFLGAVAVRVNVLYNPEMRTQVYTIPGLVAVILQLVTVSLPSFSLVRERE